MPEDVAPTSPQRLSRYRSQRKAQPAVAEKVSATRQVARPDDTAGDDDDAILRSKSRYRRKVVSNGGMEAARPYSARDPSPGSPIYQPKTQMRPQPPLIQQDQDQALAGQAQYGRSSTRERLERHASPSILLGAQDWRPTQSGTSNEDARKDRMQTLNAHQSTKPDMVLVSSSARPLSPIPQPTGELFPPPRQIPSRSVAKPVRMDGPPTSDKIRATTSLSALPRYIDDEDEDRGGCFGLFKRKRNAPLPGSEKMPIARLPAANEHQAIKAGGIGGAVPGIDAPVSAVNAGDRHVLVECGKSKTIFPVTLTTTPVDLIKGAATSMPERIDVRSAVLLEYFGTVGVQRPLRRYEHVRDVMNSWDSDRQNSFLLVDPGTGTSETELSLAGVPRRKPGDMTWLLWHSQKVGTWDKRLLTLKSDGQITIQKDPRKPQQQENVCHMSDFDIYTPTREKIRKKIKPPKKICFAVKSQQKTSMFESTENFVHFFCTADRATADSFYNAVQSWRSWYLVNIMGEGTKVKPAVEAKEFRPGTGASHLEKRPMTSDSINARPQSSGGFAKSASQFDTTASPERRTSTARRNQQYPPLSLTNRTQLAEDEPLANIVRRPPVSNKRASYDAKAPPPQDEFNEKGPRRNLSTQIKPPHKTTSNGELRPSTSRRDVLGTRDIVDLQRSGSKRSAMPERPLIDLTPQYREPPQHAKKGRGHRPEHIGAGGLIEIATSPDEPISIPPATDWRGRHAQTSSPLSQHQHHRARSTSRTRRPHEQRPGTSRSPDEQDGFTGEGLLAGGSQGWGGGDRGRGYMDGSHARGPMLDVHERSKFVQGSLLNKVERERPSVPIVDRGKSNG